MKPLLPIIDCGHGSLVRGSDGEVLYDTAPKKMYDHGIHGIAYEGAQTRRIADCLIKRWGKEENRPYINLTDTNLDIGLDNRVNAANALFKDYQNKYNCLYLSIHLNGGKGTGFEVFTSPGQTKSDLYADILAEELIKKRPDIKFRADKAPDGDYDKEAKFYVLTKTAMPAVLCELLFFDRLKDWKIIKTDYYPVWIADALVKFLKRAEIELQ